MEVSSSSSIRQQSQSPESTESESTTTTTIATLNVKEKLLDGYLSKKQERGLVPHISDLSNCLRRVCFSRLDPNPTLNDKSIRNFLIGQLFHNQLEGLLGDGFICEKEIIWTGPRTGIKVIAHPDAIWFNPTNGSIVKIPIEIKTTDSKLVQSEGPSFLHKQQLLRYMAILDPPVPFGKLFYILLGSKIDNPFYEFKITFDHENHRTEILDKLEYDAIELSHGMLAKNPALVSHIANDSNYLRFGKNWMCSLCEYREHCTDLRKKAGEEVVASQVEQEDLLTIEARRGKAKSMNNISIENLISEIKCRQHQQH